MPVSFCMMQVRGTPIPGGSQGQEVGVYGVFVRKILFNSFVTVTVLERGERILSTYQPDISKSVKEVLREEGIALHTKANVGRVHGDQKEVVVTAQTDGRQKEIKAA